MAFEVFTRDFGRTSAPKVTINNLGRFTISNTATKMMRRRQEKFALLLWDKATFKVGIQPVLKEDDRTYPLKTSGAYGRNGVGFSAVTFLNFINYDWSETRSFPVEWWTDGNMLTFTIPEEFLKGKKQPPPSVRDIVGERIKLKIPKTE